MKKKETATLIFYKDDKIWKLVTAFCSGQITSGVSPGCLDTVPDLPTYHQ